jgi:hypothetical protein
LLCAGRTDFRKFIVEGEQHYGCNRLCQADSGPAVAGLWPALGYGVAGVAIDRFTGKVLDKQIEVVNE